jgi:hypothetical protein
MEAADAITNIAILKPTRNGPRRGWSEPYVFWERGVVLQAVKLSGKRERNGY